MEFLPKERSPWWFFYGGILALVSILFLSFFISKMLGNISAIIYLFVYTQFVAFLGFHGKKTWLFWGVAGHIIGVLMLANYDEITKPTSTMTTHSGPDGMLFEHINLDGLLEDLIYNFYTSFKIVLPWFAGFFLGGIFQAITDNIAARKNMKS